MACPAQSMLSASSCIFMRNNKLQAIVLRGAGITSSSSSSSNRLFLVSCNASSSSSSSSPPAPAPPQDEADCNEEECAPEKEVGSLSVEWLAEERTKVVGTFPPKKKGWTGYVEKDTAGQTNIYSVEPAVYVAESVISSGVAGTSAEGSENTAAVTAGLALISIAAASSILFQVSKNQPQVQAPDYAGPPLSYYVAKFQPGSSVEAPPVVALQPGPSVEAAAPEAPTVEASAASPDAEQLSS